MLWVTFRFAAGGRRGAAGGAVRLHRRRAGPVCPRHAPEHVERRGVHRAVRRGDHGRRAHGPLDLDPPRARHGPGRGDRGGRRGTPAADPDDVDRGHLRPLAGVAGHRPGVRRAAAAGHGHRLGVVQFHDPHALRRARLLPHPGPRPSQDRGPGGHLGGRGADAGRAFARRDYDRHRRPAWNISTAAAASRTCSTSATRPTASSPA